METIKLCIDAITAIPDKLWLVSMYEDTNIEAYEEARTNAEWICEHGGPFLLVEQYSSVDAACRGAIEGHYDCWHYDPYYALYLVPLNVWQICQADVLGIQAEHQHKYSQCQGIDPNFERYEEIRRRDAEIPF